MISIQQCMSKYKLYLHYCVLVASQSFGRTNWRKERGKAGVHSNHHKSNVFGETWCNKHQLRWIFVFSCFFLRNAKLYVFLFKRSPTINIYQLYLHLYHVSFFPIPLRSLTNSAFQRVSTCKSTNSSREAKVKVKANQNDPPETWLQEGVFVARCLFCLQDICKTYSRW